MLAGVARAIPAPGFGGQMVIFFVNSLFAFACAIYIQSFLIELVNLDTSSERKRCALTHERSISAVEMSWALSIVSGVPLIGYLYNLGVVWWIPFTALGIIMAVLGLSLISFRSLDAEPEAILSAGQGGPVPLSNLVHHVELGSAKPEDGKQGILSGSDKGTLPDSGKQEKEEHGNSDGVDDKDPSPSTTTISTPSSSLSVLPPSLSTSPSFTASARRSLFASIRVTASSYKVVASRTSMVLFLLAFFNLILSHNFFYTVFGLWSEEVLLLDPGKAALLPVAVGAAEVLGALSAISFARLYEERNIKFFLFHGAGFWCILCGIGFALVGGTEWVGSPSLPGGLAFVACQFPSSFLL